MNVTIRFPDEMMARLDVVRESKKGQVSVGLPSRHAMVLLAVSRFLEAEESPWNPPANLAPESLLSGAALGGVSK